MTKAEIAKEWALSRVGCPYLMGGTGQICTVAYRQARMTQYPDYATKMKNNCQRLKSNKTTCEGCKWYDSEAGKGKRAYDCAQLARWCMNYVGITLVSGANSQWNQTAWAEKGPLSNMPKQMLCLVYRWDEDKKRMGHVGIYLGDGTVVHAKGHDYGVVHQELSSKDFTHYGIPAGLYEGTFAYPVLKKGITNQFVEWMQKLLVENGYALPATKTAKNGCDGIFGAQTEAVLIQFQKDRGLTPDGICNTAVWEALGIKQPDPVAAPSVSDDETSDQTGTDEEWIKEVKEKILDILDIINKKEGE